jgi:PAS domain S-box-containing protein
LKEIEIWEIGFFKNIVANKDKFIELQQKKYVRYENLPLETSDGRKIDVEFVSNVYSVNSHKVIQCNIRDITEHKRVEKEITMLAHSLKSIKECVSITDLEDNILFVNKSFLKTYGYNENELIGKNIRIVNSQKNSMKFMNKIRPNTVGEGWQGELWNKRKDGSEFLISLSTTIIKDQESKPLGLVGVAVDITESKKLETDLIAAAEIAKLGYWEYDVDSGQFTFNDQYYRLIHDSSTEKQGGNIMYAEEYAKRLVYTDDVGLVAKALQEAISSPDSEYFTKTEARVLRDDGSLANVSVQFKVLKDSSGRTYKVYGVNQDITERKLANQELIYAKEKAEQSEKLKSEFLAQMSHEIRTPVNTVSNFTNLLKEDLSKDLTPDLLEYFDGIDSASNRLMRTVDLILNTSEMQVGSYEPSFGEFDLLKEIIMKLVVENTNQIEAKGLKFNFSSTISEALIIGDQYSIHQIFANLIDNSTKYTKEGYISINVSKNELGINIQIEDSGIGMSEEFMKIVYNPFIQEEQGYSRRFDGNGLGLSLVKNYCDLNNIDITVESKRGVGTKFTLFFAKTK